MIICQGSDTPLGRVGCSSKRTTPRRPELHHVHRAILFRTKRHRWAYAGLAVVTRARAESELQGAATAASVRPGSFQDFHHALLAREMREELARVTLTRKLAALTLRLWKTGERYDALRLTEPPP